MLKIESLLADSFLTAAQENATHAIAEARAEVTREGKIGASNLEIVAPAAPDEAWLREHVIRPLVYYCQSSGAPLPDCSGVFVSLFYEGHIHFVLGAEVIAAACAGLAVDWTDLAASYGTRETERAPGRAPGLRAVPSART